MYTSFKSHQCWFCDGGGVRFAEQHRRPGGVVHRCVACECGEDYHAEIPLQE